MGDTNTPKGDEPINILTLPEDEQAAAWKDVLELARLRGEVVEEMFGALSGAVPEDKK